MPVPNHEATEVASPSQLSIHRYALGLSRRQLAERAGISARGVARLERQECMPRLKTARAISRVIGVPVNELVPEVGDASR